VNPLWFFKDNIKDPKKSSWAFGHAEGKAEGLYEAQFMTKEEIKEAYEQAKKTCGDIYHVKKSYLGDVKGWFDV